ncbi:archease [Candidatus Methylacidithermus pantelleriae]|uniref:Archease n=1 Tax=Candidatus Methylacidithermus pantelleriae TaxID=2744239 RepID=A0A8J2BIY7_9BACT|nr:archease [Candidatus Methylacidithermus pantelleriae]CAF0689845.1 Archease [Candidatus Methylacidithermus pantelleriae]
MSGPVSEGVRAPRWEHFPHGADVGIRGIGTTQEEAFEQAGIALMAVMTDPAKVGTQTVVEVEREAPQEELLLLEWLDSIIYQVAVHGLVFGKFLVRFPEKHRLQGAMLGEPLDPSRHERRVEVKGPTCTELLVRQDPTSGLWVAQCVVDV